MLALGGRRSPAVRSRWFLEVLAGLGLSPDLVRPLCPCAFSYFYKHDPELIERRLRRQEKVREQKFIMKLVYVTYVSSSTLSSHGVALLLYLPAKRL